MNAKVRGYHFCSVASAVMLFVNVAEAGFLVGNHSGTHGGNDFLPQVLEEIDEYNDAFDPDLIYPTGLFKKSEDHASFVFDPSHGFNFYEDEAGTLPITTEPQLSSHSEAYFEYDGTDANILFYSVKGPSDFGFSLYTYMPGINFLDLHGDGREISHITFWEGPPGVDPFGIREVPEPSTLVLGGIAISFLCYRRRLCR